MKKPVLSNGYKKILPQKSRIEGTGIHATKSFKRGETIFIFNGDPIHWVVKDQKTSLAGPNWVGFKKDTWIVVKAPGIYLNHSCKPNAGIQGAKKIVALRRIKAGEEVTIDYSITEEDPLWYMNCLCGEPDCRKKIRSIQSLPIAAFKRYLPFVPTYFKKVYLKYTER